VLNGNRLSICIVAPGQDLLPSCARSRHLRDLARSLGRQADVTVAFRRVPQPVPVEGFGVLEIERRRSERERFGEMSPSLRALDRFADEQLDAFDVVLESSWLLTGRVASWCAERGIPAVPIVSRVPVVEAVWTMPVTAGRTWLSRSISGQYLRGAPVIVAESAELRAAAIDRWSVPADRVEVIEPGIDRSLFHPQDQAAARERLGIPADQRILVYAGALDRAHDIAPVIEAADRVGDPALRLHVLGDGPRRADFERCAAPGGAVTFHGRVPADMVAAWIAAADLCIALDDRRTSPERRDVYTTLAVREYLASGRPVAFASGGADHPLIHHLENGFQLENHLLAWAQFLQRECPSRATLRILGQAAAAVPVSGVEDAAQAYLALCRRVARPGPVPVGAD
jgi:glycosyltransferase involved in cell wall biosynthesis